MHHFNFSHNYSKHDHFPIGMVGVRSIEEDVSHYGPQDLTVVNLGPPSPDAFVANHTLTSGVFGFPPLFPQQLGTGWEEIEQAVQWSWLALSEAIEYITDYDIFHHNGPTVSRRHGNVLPC